MKFTNLMLLAVMAGNTSAEVKLAAIFSDHAVLQRDKPIPVWDTAAAGENVTVTLRRRLLRQTLARPSVDQPEDMIFQKQPQLRMVSIKGRTSTWCGLATALTSVTLYLRNSYRPLGAEGSQDLATI